MGVDFEDINEAFTKWVNGCSGNESEAKTWLSMDGKQYDEQALYISNTKETAGCFGHGIRDHWKIENNLHWVKDVQQNEDDNLIEDNLLSINISMLQTFAMNIFRETRNTSLKHANEKYANRPGKAYDLFYSSICIKN